MDLIRQLIIPEFQFPVHILVLLRLVMETGKLSLAGSTIRFLGVNTGPGSSQTFTFSSSIDYFSIDAGITRSSE